MGIAAVIVRIMPESPTTDLDAIEDSAVMAMEKEGAQNLSFEQQPIAFGLKAVVLKMAWPEEKDTDIIEQKLAKIKHVSSAQIIDYRRAFG